MSNFNCCFDPERPENCPPSSASHKKMIIYRRINGRNPKEKDFQSDVRTKPNAPATDPKKCDCWGCSVWPSKEAVVHAIDVVPSLVNGRRKIAEGQIDEDDGVIAHTPSKSQPEHHTFWLAHEKDISGKFSIFVKSDA